MTTHDLLDRLRDGIWENHCIFNAFYDAGQIVLDSSIKTACVSLDILGTITYRFNPDFVASIDDYLLSFVFSHETLHIILNHLFRGQTVEDRERMNKAMDVVINHMLCREFGFERDMLEGWEKYCWVDTVFDLEYGIPPTNKNWEHYYKLLERQEANGDSGSGEGELMDEHNWGEDGGAIGSLEDLPEILKDHIEGRIRDLINAQAGSAALGEEFYFDKTKKKKPKWESVIKKRIQKVEQREFVEQWVFPNNRSVFLRNDCIPQSAWGLPSIEDKLDLVFFIDLSGSCTTFRGRFLKAAQSIPTERFNIKVFSFDTKVYPVDMKRRTAKGGGGTSFSVLERFLKQQGRYPDMVFCLTDGEGDPIFPEKPKNWIWFLTEEGTSEYIKNMQYFNLSDFE